MREGTSQIMYQVYKWFHVLEPSVRASILFSHYKFTLSSTPFFRALTFFSGQECVVGEEGPFFPLDRSEIEGVHQRGLS